MNSQGYSKDNIHKGNTKIVAGGIDVDGLVRVGDQSVGGDGYVLPAVKGTEGQVLTMNANNTTSFQDSGTASARVVQNLFEMTLPYNSQYITNGSGRVMYEQGTGSDIITTANLNVGDVVRFYACGYFWSNTGATLTSRFRLSVGVPNTDTSIDSYQNIGVSGGGMNTSDPVRGGRFYWWIMCNVAKIDVSNNCNITIHGEYANPSTNDMLFTWDTTGAANATRSNCRPKTENSLSGYYSTLPTTFQIRLDWLNDAGLPNDLRAVATAYRIDLMNTAEVLTTGGGGGGVSNHLLLSNLDGGVSLDGGHTNMFVISGVKPMIGNINMNNNDIINSNFVYASTVQTDVIENSGSGFLTFTNLGGGVIPSFTPSGLDLNLGGINSVSSINNITPVGGLFSGTSDSLNVAATTAEISIMPFTFVGTVLVAPNGFSIGDCFELNLSGPFNSNNSDTLTIRLKGGPTATTLLATLVVPLNASSGSVFQLSVFFQIRAIGGPGVADIISDADLTYNQSGGGGSYVGEQALSQNNTTFATDVANVLDVTAQFSSASVNNDMTTRFSKLNKVF